MSVQLVVHQFWIILKWNLIHKSNKFIHGNKYLDWFYNQKNKGRELSHILPEILKAQAALEAADEEEEEDEGQSSTRTW